MSFTTFLDLTGTRVKTFTVLERVSTVGQSLRWLCRCDCGAAKILFGVHLRRGRVGCECMRTRKTDEALHTTWQSMMGRCHRTNDKSYANYGGRGISVCERWHDIYKFVEDMGPKPPGTSLDRINNDGNYEPGNCRWATNIEQQSNKRNSVTLTHNGITDTLAGWSRTLGIMPNTLRGRMLHNFTEAELFAEGHHKKRLCTKKEGRLKESDVYFHGKSKQRVTIKSIDSESITICNKITLKESTFSKHHFIRKYIFDSSCENYTEGL